MRLAIGATVVEAEVLRHGKPIWKGSAVHAGPEDLAQVIARLASDGAPLSGKPPVRVELLPPVVQLRTLDDLPPVRRRALGDMVSLQRSRFFRQNGKPLLTDACWLPRRKGKPPTARAAAVEEPWSEAAIEACRALGLEVEAIHPAGGRIEAGLDLMPEGERSVRDRRARIAIRRWAIVAGMAWLVLGGISVARFLREERRVRSRLEALAEPAAAMGRAREALRAGSATLAAVSISESERPEVLRRFSAAVVALPDSSHLTVLELDLAGRGSMTGVARRTADVIDALDAGEAIVAPRLVGSDTKVVAAGQGWQPFTVEFGRSVR